MARVRVVVLEGAARIGLGHTGGEVTLAEGEQAWEGDVSDVQHLTIQTMQRTQKEEVARADMLARGASVPLDPKGAQNKHPTTEKLIAEESKRPQLIGSSGTENPNTVVDPRAVISPKIAPPSRVNAPAAVVAVPAEGTQSTTASKEARESGAEAAGVGADSPADNKAPATRVQGGPADTNIKVKTA